MSVTSVAELQRAVTDARSGTTILLQPGRYVLAEPLRLGGRPDAPAVSRLALRGAGATRDDVVIAGRGLEIRGVDGVQVAWLSFVGIDGVAIEIAGAGARQPHVYNVRFADASGTMLRTAARPGEGPAGAVDDGVVEHSVFEYTDVAATHTSAGGISIGGGRNWIIRYNEFRDIRSGRDAVQRFRPAVAVRSGAENATTHNNVFIDCERGIVYGMARSDAAPDNVGGVIYNNFIYRRRGLSGDAGIMLWGSPGTKVYHNTVVQNGTYKRPIEYRFASTRDVDIRNNLTDGAIEARDGAQALLVGNSMRAIPELFRNAAAGDLRLVRTAQQAIDRGVVLPALPYDWDGQARPFGPRPDIGAHEWRP